MAHMNQSTNGVLRPVDNSGHIGNTYKLNTNVKWK